MKPIPANVVITTILAWLMAGLLINPALATSDKVGVTSFARGTVAAQQPQQSPRLLAKGSDIFRGDNIQTSEKSFAIISFDDTAKITIRPNSSFSINAYINTPDLQQAELELHKGGVRASTGDIAKKRPDNYQINTAFGSISAQQADYSIRVCADDCAQENRKLKSRGEQQSTTGTVIARVVKIQGQVSAQNLADDTLATRLLALGAPLYSSDRLSSAADSFALLVFRDGGRITLQANSQFDISHYQYQFKQDSNEQAVYSLITGGLRALTGKIGNVNKEDFRIDTPVATIGIRGTGFDLLCQGKDCSNEDIAGSCADQSQVGEPSSESCLDNDRLSPFPQANEDTSTPEAQAEGLHSYVWDSAITQTNQAGSYQLAESRANYIANQHMAPLSYPSIPSIFLNNPAPRPDEVEVDLWTIFSTTTLTGFPAGVYVFVHEGHVQFKESGDETLVLTEITAEASAKTTPGEDEQGRLLDLGKNEVAYIDPNGNAVRLDQQPDFQAQDPYPLPTELTLTKEAGTYSVLSDSYDIRTDSVYQCVAK